MATEVIIYDKAEDKIALSNADFGELANDATGTIDISDIRSLSAEKLARLKSEIGTMQLSEETKTGLQTLLKETSSAPAALDPAQQQAAPASNNNTSKVKESKHSNESTPVVLNYIRAIELGLIGATPKENLAAFSAVKGNDLVKGTWNGLKAGNDRIPKVMNWANYLHTNPWIRPDLESAISMEKAANKALLTNKNLLNPTREALHIREQYLTQMSDALTRGDHARFGTIAGEYRADATSGRIAREATHIDDAIAHSILKENIPEHEKTATKTKEKAEKTLTESTTKIEELKAEHKKLEEEIRKGGKDIESFRDTIAEKDRLVRKENATITSNKQQYVAETAKHKTVLDKIEDLKNGTHITSAITAKNSQIATMESRITTKNSELAVAGIANNLRTAYREERTQLEGQLNNLQSEKVNLLAAEETRLNRVAEGHKNNMDGLHSKIETSESKIAMLDSEKTQLLKQQSELVREVRDKNVRKLTIKSLAGIGELKTQEDLKKTTEGTLKNHESLQKAKTALETELAKPRPDVAEVTHLRTEYERLAGSGAVPTPADRGPQANVRMHEGEKVSFDQAKVEVDRIEARLSVIEGEINTKISAIDEQLKTGKISKTQAYIEVDKIIAPYNLEFEGVQRAGLAHLERLDPESFKKILGQSQWLKTLNKGNGLMDKFDGKVGKWAGLAVVGLMAKHSAETGWTPELKNDLIDAGIGIIPIVGGIHDLRIAASGRDLNDRKVEGWDRAGRVAFGVLGLTGVGSIVKWIGKGAQSTDLAIKSVQAGGKLMDAAKATEQLGEAGIRLLEPVRLVGRPVMYAALGITLYQGTMSLLPSKKN